MADLRQFAAVFDWKGIIATFSLIISAFTAYFSFLRGPRLRPQLGEVILLRSTGDKKLWIAPELAIFNSGARVAVISKITARLRSIGDGREVNLLWNANLTTEHIPWNEPNRRFRTHTRFESFPEIIFVPKSAAVVKRLELVSGQSLDLVEGDYSLFLTIRTESRSVRVVTLKRTIRIRRQDESFLLASTVPSDQRAENLRLHFDYEVDVYVSLRPYAATSTPSAAPAN